MEPDEAGAPKPPEPGPGKATPESVTEALRPVHDPELMISIVDLGLVYGVEVSSDGKRVDVSMTLTSPGCPIGPELMAAVEHTARMVPGVEDVSVRLPVDWDSVDPIPRALAEVLRRPLPVDLDLSDVAPGEPEHAHAHAPVG